MFKFFENWQKAKRKKWEMANLSKEQKEKYFSSGEQGIISLFNKINKLEAKYEMLNSLISKKIIPKWRVIQDQNKETEWIREGQPTYVSKIYNKDDNWHFTSIIDGQSIIFSYESYEIAQQQKLLLLDVERIEEYNSIIQTDTGK